MNKSRDEEGRFVAIRAEYFDALANKIKQCPKCKEFKPGSQYARSSSRGKPKLQPYCKPCFVIYTRSRPWRKPSHRTAYLRKHYGITQDDYNRMFAEQGGVCCICGQEESGNPFGVLEVDHNNKTGKVRELVCHPCNTAIAWYENWLKFPHADAVVEYIEKHAETAPIKTDDTQADAVVR